MVSIKRSGTKARNKANPQPPVSHGRLSNIPETHARKNGSNFLIRKFALVRLDKYFYERLLITATAC